MPALKLAFQLAGNAIAHLSDFNWLILTSTNGVDFLSDWEHKDGRALAGVKIAVVGEKTAQSLKQRSHRLYPAGFCG